MMRYFCFLFFFHFQRNEGLVSCKIIQWTIKMKREKKNNFHTHNFDPCRRHRHCPIETKGNNQFTFSFFRDKKKHTVYNINNNNKRMNESKIITISINMYYNFVKSDYYLLGVFFCCCCCCFCCYICFFFFWKSVRCKSY